MNKQTAIARFGEDTITKLHNTPLLNHDDQSGKGWHSEEYCQKIELDDGSYLNYDYIDEYGPGGRTKTRKYNHTPTAN